MAVETFAKIMREEFLSHKVESQIREAIRQKVFVPGDKLPGEFELSEKFGVSRTAIREALRMLSGRGMVDIRKGSGVYVTEMGIATVVEPLYTLLDMKCGDAACRRARKAAWQKQKMASDPEYHARQSKCAAKWRKKRPVDKYMRQYRDEHSKYVEQNRLAQKARNRYHRMVVNMDASTAAESITCLVTPYMVDKHGNIVKMGAYLAKIAVLQQDRRSARAAAL